ncbi:MAG: hemerythrin domain-containing protein [Bryobacteraceae bacterium]
MSALAQPSSGESKATLDKPLEHLLACHQRILERMSMLERATAAAGEKPEESAELIAKVLRFLDSNGAWHTEDEENSVFPRLAGKVGEDEVAYLNELTRQHEDLDAALDRFKAERSQANAAALADGYRKHIAFEESRLGGIIKRVLSEEEFAAVSVEMKQRRGIESAC